MKPVQVRIVPVLKACRNNILTRMAAAPAATTLAGPPPLTPPPPPPPSPPPSPPVTGRPKLPRPYFLPPTYGNYCLDLFFDNVLEELRGTPASDEYLNHMLHVAWFHNPLTTVKLICHLLDRRCCPGKTDRETFYTAAYWLHRHHPRTLACNVATIVSSFGSFDDIIEILYRLLQGQDVRKKQSELMKDGWDEFDCLRIRKSNSQVRSCRRLVLREVRVMKAMERSKLQEEKARTLRRGKIFALADTALERYKKDSDFRFLHERISDVFAQCLKCDIANLSLEKDVKYDRDQDCLELSMAADYCPKVGSSMDYATLLCESIAKKVFPRELYPEYEGIEEAHYAYRVRDRLRKEVLVPLRKALDIADYHAGANQWGYNPDFKREPCAVKKYLEEVKEGAEFMIVANALLPHEIIRYVKDEDVGEIAELQWKAMVEDTRMNKRMSILNKCLAVCDVSVAMNGPPRDVSAGLALMMSELSEDPWKGKVIAFSELPQLNLIQGGDLKSKCEFLKNMDWGYRTDFRKVFDLILEEAVSAKLKPQQMVKKVFVLTNHIFFDEASDSSWESEYEAIQSEFKKKGYGNVVPQLVYWNLIPGKLYKPVHCGKEGLQGVWMLSGFNDNLIKSFLDNDGDIGMEHVMEAAISGHEYQKLIVVD